MESIITLWKKKGIREYIHLFKENEHLQVIDLGGYYAIKADEVFINKFADMIKSII